MAPHELIVPEACSIGTQADQYALESNLNHPSTFRRQYLKQKNKLLSRDKLRQKCILEDMPWKRFPDVPLTLPPCQIRNAIPSQADPKRAAVNLVFSRPTQACDFERHARQRGCKSHSPELTGWSELFYVPPAQQAALAWGNILL